MNPQHPKCEKSSLNRVTGSLRCLCLPGISFLRDLQFTKAIFMIHVLGAERFLVLNFDELILKFQSPDMCT